ncbi:hypothetical protein A2U01_0101342, partial [Trifolium medium]|nr:hypothetical protein [Trifolium medium]
AYRPGTRVMVVVVGDKDDGGQREMQGREGDAGE